MRLAVLVLALVLAAVAVVPGTAPAQNMFLRSGQSGFGLAGELRSGEEWLSRSLVAGYSILGLNEFSVLYSKVSFEEYALAGFASFRDIEATVIRPSLAVTVLKQSAEVPLSVELCAAYEHHSYSGGVIDLSGAEASASGYSLGGAIHSRFAASPSLTVIPRLSVVFSSMDIQATDPYGRSHSADDDAWLVGFGAALAFVIQPGRSIYLFPALSASDEETSFGVSLGLALATSLLEP
jgi:hypothetical protein